LGVCELSSFLFAFGYKPLRNIVTLLHFLFRVPSDITRFPYTLLIIFTIRLLVPPKFHFLFKTVRAIQSSAECSRTRKHVTADSIIRTWGESKNILLSLESQLLLHRNLTFCTYVRITVLW